MDVKVLNNKRSKGINILHYVVLPAIIIGHEIVVDIFLHYSGTVGLANIFNIDTFTNYLSTHWTDLIVVVIVAFIIVGIVEYILNKVEKG